MVIAFYSNPYLETHYVPVCFVEKHSAQHACQQRHFEDAVDLAEHCKLAGGSMTFQH
jgi:hypothetical protein